MSETVALKSGTRRVLAHWTGCPERYEKASRIRLRIAALFALDHCGSEIVFSRALGLVRSADEGLARAAAEILHRRSDALTPDSARELYARLYDEDVAMMVERQAKLDAVRAPRERGEQRLELGALKALRSRLPLEIDWQGRPYRVLELDGELLAHATVCPHWLGPLEAAPIEGGKVVCPWHGYAFDIVSQRECSGRRMRLSKPPRVLVDAESGQVTLARYP